jgi:hypothetical protein
LPNPGLQDRETPIFLPSNFHQLWDATKNSCRLIHETVNRHLARRAAGPDECGAADEGVAITERSYPQITPICADYGDGFITPCRCLVSY